MSSTFYLRAATALGASGVLLAAYGAHGIEKRVNGDAGKVKAWTSAAHIQLLHAVALLAISQSPRLLLAGNKLAAPLILAGTGLFSGSIYALILNRDVFRPLGPVTPLGGLILTAGWVALAF